MEERRSPREQTQALQRSEARCRALVDSLKEGVCLLDGDGRLVEVNAAALAMLEVSASDVLGKTVGEIGAIYPQTLFSRQDGSMLEPREHPALRALQGGHAVPEAILGLGQGYKTRWVTVNAAPVHLDGDLSGVAGGVIVSFIDVTRMVEMQRSLAQSESRFRDFAESAGDWLWETDVDGRFTYCSSPYLDEVFGSRNFMLGKHRKELAARSPGDDPIWAQYNDDIKNRRPLREFVYRIIGRDNSFRWVKVSGKAVYDHRGVFVGYRGVGSDVTQLRESQDKFRAIFDRTFQFIGLLDRDGVLIEANRRALAAVGLNSDDVCGKFFWDTPWWTHSPPDRLRLKAGVALARQGEFVRFEASHQTPAGLLTVDFSLSPWFDENGQVVWIIPEGRDITDRKRHEIELQSKSQFLATMSHELRTPLNAILGYSELVLEEAFGPIENQNYKDYLSYIHDAGQRLLAVIQDILEIAHIETGHVDLEIEPLKLDDLAEKARQLIAHHADSKRLSLEIKVEEGLGAFSGDRKKMIQVLVNLLINAVKFTAPGGSIGLIAEQAAGGTRFTVWDTGIGIASENLRKIWEPFGQVESAWVRSAGGSGLGLTLARHLVEAQGGTIAVDSLPGQGSRFILSFPPSDMLM